MRPKGTKQDLEIRRRTAMALLEAGLGVCEVARRVGAGSGSVSRWKKTYLDGGPDALKAKPHPNAGSRPRLSDSQVAALREIMLSGARAAGYPTELWTLRRVAEVIGKSFGVMYTQSGVWHVLRRMAFSPQKPERRARERDDEAVRRWRSREWPRIKGGRSAAGGRSS